LLWLPLVGVVLLAATVMGWLLARDSLWAYLLLGALALVVAIGVFTEHVFGALVIWAAAEGVAYPFVRYPLNHNLATFDRFMLLALGGAVAIAGSKKLTRDGRRLVWAFGVFALVYGVRAFLTERLPLPPNYGRINFADVSAYQVQADWLDCVALPFIVFLVAARTMTRARWAVLAKALSFCGVTVAIIALLEWALGFQLSTLSGYSPFVDTTAGVVRVSGPYQDPSAYGGVMVVCLAATVYWMTTERAYIAGTVALLIETLSLAPTFTKTIWGAGFVTLVLALGLRRRGGSRLFLVGLYSSTVIGVIYTLLHTNPVVAQRVTGSNDNFIARIGDYIQALYIFEHWPVFGAGAGQFIAAQQFVPYVVVNDVVATPSAHNTFLSVLAELGLVGFIPLLVFTYAIVRVVRALRRSARTTEEVIFATTVIAATVGYLLLSLTLVEIYYPPSGMFLALVLGAAAARVGHMGAERVRSRVKPPETIQRGSKSRLEVGV
jgi:O-antigen ligase